MRYVVEGRFTVEIMDELIISAMPKSGWVTDETWMRYVDFCADLVAKHGPFHAWLIIVFQHGPSAKQRKYMSVDSRDKLRLTEVWRSAMVTDSSLLRGMLTAAGWLTRTEMQTMGVSPKNVETAITWMREKAKFDPDRALAVYESLRDAAQD
jgi:hypothetical protein